MRKRGRRLIVRRLMKRWIWLVVFQSREKHGMSSESEENEVQYS